MTNSDLKKLRKKLPTDGVKKIKEKTGFSRQYINQVLSGDKLNLDIIDAAIEVAIDYKNELDQKTKVIHNL